MGDKKRFGKSKAKYLERGYNIHMNRELFLYFFVLFQLGVKAIGVNESNGAH